MSHLLGVRDLRLDLFIDGEKKPILRDVALTLDSGEALGLVGESGAGKSMVAKCITRMLPPGSSLTGDLTFDGLDIHDLTTEQLGEYRRGGVALIPQNPQAAINPVYSIGDFLTEPLLSNEGVTRKVANERAIAAMDEVGISDAPRVLGQFPHELSGGMLQRVIICSALLSESKLIVADEPTTALDATTQSEVMAILSDLQKSRDLALLFITHDLELAVAICDRIAVIYAGEIVEVQPAKQLEAAPRHPYTRGLFGAAPRIDGERTRLAAIPGRAEAAFEVEAGCPYAKRCAWATDECRSEHPSLEGSPVEAVRCIRVDEIESAQADIQPGIPNGSREVGGGPAPKLRVKDLRKVFQLRGDRRGTSFTAVDGISFDLSNEESLAIVGESGSGKTTLARMIAGLERPTSGEFNFDGDEIEARPRKLADRRKRAKKIQMVFQNPLGSLDPSQNGKSCLDEVLRIHAKEMSTEQRRDRVLELGQQVGLGERELELRPRQLSGGQRQRLAIARALAVEPEILILDEAVSALDVSVQAQILNLLSDIRNDTGIAYLFISHDLAVVRQVSDRVIVMKSGQVVETGETEEVLDRPQHPYTRLLRSSVPTKGWQPTRR